MRIHPSHISPRRTAAAILAASVCVLAAASAPAAARDVTPPRITSAATRDVDGDGRVDTIRVRYSERVGLLSGKGSRKLRVAGYTVQSSRLASPNSRLRPAKACYPRRSIRRVSRTVVVKVAEQSAPDTAAKPTVTYTRSARSGRKVVDRACREAFSGLYRSTKDGAPPILVSAATADGDSDGKLDGVSATFSEPVSHPGSIAAPFKLAVASMTVNAVDAATTATNVHVDFGEGGAPNSASKPAVTYNPAAGGAAAKDAAGNAVATAATVPSSDAAKPVVLGAVTADQNGNGRLDAVDLTFSEAVTHPSDSDGTYPLSVESYSIASVGAATGVNVRVSLTEGSPDTGFEPEIDYAAGPGAAIVDSAGNQPQNGSFTGTSDGAAPVLLEAGTADKNDNGKLDALRLTFSEPLNYPGQNPGPYPFAIPGRAVTSTSATINESLMVNFSEDAPFDTGAQPDLAYAPGTGTPVVDTAALAAPAKSFAPVDDRAGPAIVAAATTDADADGKLDLIRLTLSEAVTHQNQTSGPYPLSVEGRAVAGVSAPSGAGNDRIDVTFDEFGHDTGALPKVTYTGDGSLPIRDPADNPPPGNDVTPTDGARPIVISGQATENGAANGRIDTIETTWSEPVSHAADTDGSYPLAVTIPAGPFSFAGGIPAVSGASLFDLTLTEQAAPDRDKSPSVAYDAAGPDAPVLDAAGNEALTWSAPVTRACNDPNEGNSSDDDSRVAARVLGSQQQQERLCGGDDDWYQINVGAAPATVKVLVLPAQTIDPSVELTDSTGARIGAVQNSGGPGANELLNRAVGSPGSYFIHVFSPGFSDGSYCVEAAHGTGSPPDPQCFGGPGGDV